MATWKKLITSGSAISQLNNDAGYITSGGAVGHAFTTASWNSINLLAGSTDGTLTFTSGSYGSTGLTISASAANDTIDLSLNSIPNAALAVSSIKIGNASFNLGTTASLAATGYNSGSFSGSFQGDGSSLTGIATALDVSGSTGAGVSTNGSVNLKTQDFTIAGTANEIDTSMSGQTLTIGLPDNVTISGDLVVQGTASFNHEQTLMVEDRFILLASGSSATGDGGIVIQQATQGIGEVFGFDGVSGTTRWGVTGSFNSEATSFTPDAFMAAVSTGNATTNATINTLVADRYEAKGNIFIGDDQGIWIYS